MTPANAKAGRRRLRIQMVAMQIPAAMTVAPICHENIGSLQWAAA